MTRSRARAADRVSPPDVATLRQFYVVQDRSLDDLARRYRVGRPTARGWLTAAGIPIRSRGDGGRRRLLQPPAVDELRRLCEEGLSVHAVAGRLAVSYGTAARWLAEAGLAPVRGSMKNRPRGADRPVAVPDRGELWRLYVTEGRSITDVAQVCGASTHLVRTWLAEAGIVRRPAGGRPGVPHRVPRRKTPPPVEELAELQSVQRLSRRQLAERYGVHVATMSQWLTEAGLPTRLPPTTVSAPEVVRMYEAEGLTAAEIARRTGASTKWVLRRLHAAGVQIDRTRQIAAVRAAAANRPRPPALPPEEGDRAERRYREDGWAYSRIAAELGRPVTAVRRELAARGVPPAPPLYPGRASRRQVPVPPLERLYVEAGHTAEQVGAALGVRGHVVLRVGHANGVPIRQGGFPTVSATVELIDGLYADEIVAAVLHRHGVPHRPAAGDIAVRFRTPVPLTAELLTDLYQHAGCSTTQIELLTGQSRAVVEQRMRDWGVPLRDGHVSPALLRLRAAAREVFLADVVARYDRTRSTAAVAAELGCATGTVHRWLLAAGRTVPGRGKWARRRRR